MVSAVRRAALGSAGVELSFTDVFGRVREVSECTLSELDEVFDEFESSEVIVCSPGVPDPRLKGSLVLETGSSLEVDGVLDVLGYHYLTKSDGSALVVCAPSRFEAPPRGWGFALQLYAARSRGSWGIGDFEDLRLVAHRAASVGAGSVLISPVHASAPLTSQQASPYSPASRSWLSLMHVRPESVPGAHAVDLSDLMVSACSLNELPLIDRAAVWELKLEAFERVWVSYGGVLPSGCARWVESKGEELESFALWSTLVEFFQSADWRSWPRGFSHPGNAEVKEFLLANRERVLFHSWLQWAASLQFEAACNAGATVITDLAVGFDSSSMDAWVHQDSLALGWEVGCPPDRHNPDGQRWGLPPFNPAALAADGFKPFISMVRQGLEHAGALRMDHVMQLWRLFWVPCGRSAADGVYVRYPAQVLLSILRLEASRRSAWVVGEDMGTVPSGVREAMASCGMLGYRVAVRTPPADYPDLVVAASSTHDQVTVAGLITGSDALDLERIGKDADFKHIEESRRALAAEAGVDLGGDVSPVMVERAVLTQYAKLVSSPARVVLVAFDDALMVAKRPNMPGTVSSWPNWCLGLPVFVEDFFDQPLVGELVSMMNSRK